MPDQSEVSIGAGAFYDTHRVGTVALGFSRQIYYRPTPRYRAVQFHAEAGTQLELFVRSTHGDPMMWLTDVHFNVLASSDDANDSTNAAISIGHFATTGDYYIVFRDKDYERHAFDVAALQLNLPPDAPTLEAVKAEYERLVASRTLGTLEVIGEFLPFLAQELYHRWRGEIAGAPGAQVNAYVLDVAGKTVWLVRRYEADGRISAAAFAETGPMLGMVEGTPDPIGRRDN